MSSKRTALMSDSDTIYFSENFRTRLGGFGANFDDYVLNHRGAVLKERRNFEAKSSHLAGIFKPPLSVST